MTPPPARPGPRAVAIWALALAAVTGERLPAAGASEPPSAQVAPPQPGAPTATTQPPNPPPHPWPPPAPAPPVAGHPQDPWAPPPPGVYHGYPPPPAPHLAYVRYEAGKRTHGLAMLLEAVFPGIGSIYADHVMGALITWCVGAAGAALMVFSFSRPHSGEQTITPTSDRVADAGVLTGFGVMVGARIFGFVDAWRSTTRYNDRLRVSLGLSAASPPGPLAPAAGRRMVLLPQLRLSF